MSKRKECATTTMTSSSSSSSSVATMPPDLAGDGGHGGELIIGRGGGGGVDGAAKHHHHQNRHNNHHHQHHHVPPPQQRRRRLLCLTLFLAGMMIATLSGLYSIRMMLLGAAGDSGDVSFLEPTPLEAAAAAAAAATTLTSARQESSHSLLRRSPLLSKKNSKTKKDKTTDDPHNKLKIKLPNNKVIASHNTTSSSSSSSSSSNVIFFPPMVVTPKRSLKNNNNNNNNSTTSSSCRIGPTSTFRYVGCGYNGQVFAVNCENHHHHEQQRRRRQPKQQKQQQQQQKELFPPFVVKLLTIPANRSDKKKFGNGRIGMYKSDKPENTLRYRDLYQRLLLLSNTSNTTNTTTTDDDDDDDKEKVLRHFALQRGVVNLSPDILFKKAAAAANRSLTMNSPFRGMVLDPLPGTSTTEQEKTKDGESPPLVIQGKVYGCYKGQSIRVWLRPKEKFDNTSRLFYEKRQYQVIRDLIYIYRHLYRQHILICDLKLDHFLYSSYTNDTTLIDMDEFLYGRGIKARPDRPYFNTYTEQWQQWQLLTVIANVCDYEVQHERERENALLSPAGLASIVCGGKGAKKSTSLLYEAEETWASSFAKCGLDRPMRWSRDMLNHTEATYEALATWSGLIAP